jgi:hypothetical protein
VQASQNLALTMQYISVPVLHSLLSLGLYLDLFAYLLPRLSPQVFTSDIKGAGTDANVTIILFGCNGLDTGKIKLDSHKNNFERGQVSDHIFIAQFV